MFALQCHANQPKEKQTVFFGIFPEFLFFPVPNLTSGNNLQSKDELHCGEIRACAYVCMYVDVHSLLHGFDLCIGPKSLYLSFFPA